MEQINQFFQEDERLGIELPKLNKSLEEFSVKEQSKILSYWEKQRSKIPDRIKELEKTVSEKTRLMLLENDEWKMIQLNDDIVRLASIINDLNIWFRVEPAISGEKELVGAEKKGHF